MSYVYFLKMEGMGGPIKIGWSIHPQSRAEAFQTGSPFPLRLLKIIEGGRQLEQALHRELTEHRLKGEWFRDCGPVRAAMDRYGPAAAIDRPYTLDGISCDNCGALLVIYEEGICKACEEFAGAREGDRDPFDTDLERAA